MCQGIIQTKFGRIRFFCIIPWHIILNVSGDNTEKVWAYQIFVKQKTFFGRHVTLSKPAMHFILDDILKPIYFFLYFSDLWPSVIPLRVGSHTQLLLQLIYWCYKYSSYTCNTTLLRRCAPTEHGKKRLLGLYYSYRRNRHRFIYLL